MSVSDLVRPVRSDVTSGASSVLRSALNAYRAALDEALDRASLRPFLAELGRALIDAQPAMAPLFNLACHVLEAARQEPVEPERVRAALDAFERRIGDAARAVAERAEGLIPAGGRVLTLSASGTVRTALLHAASRRTFDVVCLEGRPNLEGRSLARALDGAGVRVVLAVDAAAALLLRDSDVVIVGADSVGDLGIANKIGTRPVALAARRCGVPIYALADSTKLLPVGRAQRLDDQRPAGEVWSDAPGGVVVFNQYFEATPLGFFDGVVMEGGLGSAADIEAARAQGTVPSELA